MKNATGICETRRRIIRSYIPLAFALCSVCGCTTRAVHFAVGEVYADHIDAVEKAWAGTNELCVCVRGVFGPVMTNSGFTLRYRPLDFAAPAGKAGNQPVLLSRSLITPGWPVSGPEHGFRELSVECRIQTNDHFRLKYFELFHPGPGKGLILTENAMLRVPTPAHQSETSENGHTWYIYPLAKHRRFWAVPMIPVALAGDLSFLTACGLGEGKPPDEYFDFPPLSNPLPGSQGRWEEILRRENSPPPPAATGPTLQGLFTTLPSDSPAAPLADVRFDSRLQFEKNDAKMFRQR